MKETNYSKQESILNRKGGFITRSDVDKASIPSWFLSDFVRKNKLIKIAPGFYADDNYVPDNGLRFTTQRD